MRHAALKQVALLVLALVAASMPAAAEPSAGNSVTPPCISLVGTSGGIPARGAGAFEVIVRDLANNPIVGAQVVIDLSDCPELHLCADQGDPDAIVNCAAKTVRKLTDATGTVGFTLLGGSNGAGDAGELLHAGKIYEDGFLIGSPTVSAFDLDGAGGVGINDLSAWLTDFGTAGAPAFGRSDYDCSGTVSINDFSLLLTALGSGAQLESCAATCP
jgi:hypothetical protein